MFTTILKPERLDTLIEGSTAESLALIGMLTKISNSPVLLKAQLDKARTSKGEPKIRPGVMEAVGLLPDRAQIEDFSLSGKLTWSYAIHDDNACAEGKLTAVENLLKTLRQVCLIDLRYPAAEGRTAHGREMYFSLSLYLYSQYPGSFLQETTLYVFASRWVRTK